jgi:hypothetical protein
MFKRHDDKLRDAKIENADLVDLNATMKLLERFWASQTSFSGLASLDDSDL